MIQYNGINILIFLDYHSVRAIQQCKQDVKDCFSLDLKVHNLPVVGTAICKYLATHTIYIYVVTYPHTLYPVQSISCWCVAISGQLLFNSVTRNSTE